MKHSQVLTKCGTLFHPITPIIEKAKQLVNADMLVICENEEVFDEAMITMMNRFPQALGLVAVPNAGCLMPKRNANVSIRIEQHGTTMKLHVVTKAEYEADKATIDGYAYSSKHEIAFSGGRN